MADSFLGIDLANYCGDYDVSNKLFYLNWFLSLVPVIFHTLGYFLQEQKVFPNRIIKGLFA